MFCGLETESRLVESVTRTKGKPSSLRLEHLRAKQLVLPRGNFEDYVPLRFSGLDLGPTEWAINELSSLGSVKTISTLRHVEYSREARWELSEFEVPPERCSERK